MHNNRQLRSVFVLGKANGGMVEWSDGCMLGCTHVAHHPYDHMAISHLPLSISPPPSVHGDDVPRRDLGEQGVVAGREDVLCAEDVQHAVDLPLHIRHGTMIQDMVDIYTAEEDKKIEKTSIWGYKTRVTHYSGGTYDEVFFNPLAGKDGVSDIKAHKWPASNVLDFSHFPKEALEHSDRAVIGVFTWGAYFIASYVRGLENLMIDFALNRDYARYLINTISDISSSFLHTMLELYGEGIDIVYMADDYCSQQGPLFSPADFREFVVPYLKEFVDIVHKHNKNFLLHCCGAVRPLLPMIIDSGVDMLAKALTCALVGL